MPPAKAKSLSRLYWSLVVSAACAALLVIATISFAALRQAEDEWLRHTLAVRNQIVQVLTLVQRAESGQRGYLLTGRDMYLAPYEQAAQELPAALEQLGALVADNPPQQQSVGRMRQLSVDELRELKSTIDARHAGNPEGALAIVNSDTGQRMMDDVRALVLEMEHAENDLLAQRQARAATFGQFANKTSNVVGTPHFCLPHRSKAFTTHSSEGSAPTVALVDPKDQKEPRRRNTNPIVRRDRSLQ